MGGHVPNRRSAHVEGSSDRRPGEEVNQEGGSASSRHLIQVDTAQHVFEEPAGARSILRMARAGSSAGERLPTRLSVPHLGLERDISASRVHREPRLRGPPDDERIVNALRALRVTADRNTRQPRFTREVFRRFPNEAPHRIVGRARALGREDNVRTAIVMARAGTARGDDGAKVVGDVFGARARRSQLARMRLHGWRATGGDDEQREEP